MEGLSWSRRAGGVLQRWHEKLQAGKEMWLCQKVTALYRMTWVWCCGPMLNAMTSIKTLEDRRVYLYDFLLLLSRIPCLVNHCHGLSLSLVWLIFCLVNLVLVEVGWEVM